MAQKKFTRTKIKVESEKRKKGFLKGHLSFHILRFKGIKKARFQYSGIFATKAFPFSDFLKKAQKSCIF
jgi:hypothetical protein